MFQTVSLSIIRSFLGWNSVPFWSCSQVVSKPVRHMPLLCGQWKTPDDGQRNCSKHVAFHSKNKFEKLVHLVDLLHEKIIIISKCLCVYLVLLKHGTLISQVSYWPIFTHFLYVHPSHAFPLVEGLLTHGCRLQAHITKYRNVVWNHVCDISVVSLGFLSEHYLIEAVVCYVLVQCLNCFNEKIFCFDIFLVDMLCMLTFLLHVEMVVGCSWLTD